MQNLGFDLNVMALQARWNDFIEYAGSRWLPSIGVILAAILAYVIGRAVFTRIHMHFVVKGRGLHAEKVGRAIKLSADKYCSASAMLAKTAAITHDFELKEA